MEIIINVFMKPRGHWAVSTHRETLLYAIGLLHRHVGLDYLLVHVENIYNVFDFPPTAGIVQYQYSWIEGARLDANLCSSLL